MSNSRITYYFDTKNKVLESASFLKVITDISPFYYLNRFILIGVYQSNQSLPYLKNDKIWRKLYNKEVCIRDLRAEGLI